MPSYTQCADCGQRIRADRERCLSCYSASRKPRLGLGALAETLAAGRREPTDFSATPRIAGDCIVISDVHVPLHDAEWLARVCEVAQRESIRRLIVGGDFIDFQEISRFPADKPDADLDESLGVVAEVLRQLVGFFDEIHIIKGNHESRLEKLAHDDLASRSKPTRTLARLRNCQTEVVSFRDQYRRYLNEWLADTCPEAVGKVIFYTEPFCELDGPPDGKPWFLVHQKNGSRNAPTEAKNHWSNRGAQPVICTHTHLPGLRTSDDGVTPLVNLGCSTRHGWHYYANKEPNGYPVWARGMAVIRGGRLTLHIDSPYIASA